MNPAPTIRLLALVLAVFCLSSCGRVHSETLWQSQLDSHSSLTLRIHHLPDTSSLALESRTDSRIMYCQVSRAASSEFGRLHVNVWRLEGELWVDASSDSEKAAAYLRPRDQVFINQSGLLQTKNGTTPYGSASYIRAAMPVRPPSATLLFSADVNEFN